jgi:hypothetical protein
MTLTAQQKQAYLNGGGCSCPFCGCEDVVGGPVEISTGNAGQAVSCSGCAATWHDCYELVDVVHCEDGTLDDRGPTP